MSNDWTKSRFFLVHGPRVIQRFAPIKSSPPSSALVTPPVHLGAMSSLLSPTFGSHSTRTSCEGSNQHKPAAPTPSPVFNQGRAKPWSCASAVVYMLLGCSPNGGKPKGKGGVYHKCSHSYVSELNDIWGFGISVDNESLIQAGHEVRYWLVCQVLRTNSRLTQQAYSYSRA